MNRVEIDSIVKKMVSTGWQPGEMAREEEISIAEIELNVIFPEEYKKFLLLTGGTRAKKPWKGLWSVEELIGLNKTMPIFEWFRPLVGIGNEGFIVYALDYRDAISQKIVSVGLSSSDWNDITVEAETFTQWLKATIP